MAFRIYTKTGDGGETALFGGKRLPKDHIRIESYGTIDELNSYLGLVKGYLEDLKSQELIYSIQNQLFNIGSHLASVPEMQNQLPPINDQLILKMEQEIDRLTEFLPPLKNFILPGGHPSNSFCHIARCVCRRAERNVVSLDHSEKVDPIILQFLNRLSDYLFVLSRALSFWNHSEEIIWKQ